MQPADTYNLVLNYLILVMIPVIIWANLRPQTMANAASAYLWTEHRNFMRVSLLILVLIFLNSVVSLLGYYDLLSADAVETGNMVIGVPFLILAVIEVILAVRGVLKFLRSRKAGTSKI